MEITRLCFFETRVGPSQLQNRLGVLRGIQQSALLDSELDSKLGSGFGLGFDRGTARD